jgi:hypothetical protein
LVKAGKGGVRAVCVKAGKGLLAVNEILGQDARNDRFAYAAFFAANEVK